MPLRVSVPPETVRPPVPPMTPPKVVEPLVIVSVFAPSTTLPVAAPDRVWMLVLPLPETSNVPLSATPEEVRMLSAPVSVRPAPFAMVVAPV